MAETRAPAIYSIAAHRGFADALVAGLVPRYSEEGFGLARLTLLLPSSRAARTIREAFIRHAGEEGRVGMLMPRMVTVGDLDLDEALGPLFDSLGAGAAIAPAADPTRRWLRLAQLIAEEKGAEAPRGSALLRLAFEMGQAMDRLLAEEIAPQDLLADPVVDLAQNIAEHWRVSVRLFSRVLMRWQDELEERGEQDAAARRNALFRAAAQRMRDDPPAMPVIAAGVTSAAPALAALLRTVSELPQGAVILPDFDLTIDADVWDELGAAGDPEAETPFLRGDAVTHPQYHMKLLLNRMSVNRGEVRAWHRAGMAKGPPARSHAIGNLFLPPQASRKWAALPAAKRQLAGVKLIAAANPESEAQAIALLVREALEEPQKRVAVVTPDRGLAARVVQHLRRWNIAADDTAGQPLTQSAAGRALLLLAELAADHAAPVPLIGLLTHPLVASGEGRADWLRAARKLDLQMRGPRSAPGLAGPRQQAEKAGIGEWWAGVEPLLAPLAESAAMRSLADWLDLLADIGEALCGEGLWAREDGRALAAFVEDLRLHARDVPAQLEPADLPIALREAMDRVAVRPPYGGHPRIAIYGLLEARMTRADLIICGGLNEGSWPATPASDPLLPPAILRALGVPGSDFRIGLAAHDLAGALGAPEVVLSHARRDAGGPAIASRFLLRVKALLGDKQVKAQSDQSVLDYVRSLDDPPHVDPHPRPLPMPGKEQRRQDISATALDRLRSDPYQFYAANILRLKELDALDAPPSAAWQGDLAHDILQAWQQQKRPLHELAEEHLQAMGAHPLQLALWRPRLLRALDWVALQLASEPGREPLLVEKFGDIQVDGIRIFGKPDRIDRLPGGGLAIVDYKSGGPPTGAMVEAGFALQLGTLGLIAQGDGFTGVSGTPERFEYWSLGRNKDSATGFGYVVTPLKEGRKRTGILPEDFLPQTAEYLREALQQWITGEEPFKARLNPDAPGYDTYDQLMRLAEWQGREG